MTITPWLLTLLGNPMFAGLVSASALASLGYLMRDIPAKIGAWLLEVVSRQVTINNDNVSHEWLERWLSRHAYMDSYLCRSFKLMVQPSETVENDEYERVLSPGYGYHLIFHHGWPVLVDRWREEGGSPSLWTGQKAEHLRFRIFFGPRSVLDSIVDQAEALSKVIPGRIPLYVWQRGWNKAPAIRPRDKNTVYLPAGKVDDVLADADRFTQSSDWYAKVGIPYRRGYLFTGKPGTGKTTLAIAMASSMKRPVYCIPLDGLENDNELASAVMAVPRNAILLFEDIDTVRANKNREAAKPTATEKALAKELDIKEDDDHGGISLGGLLNAIDGVIASEGRILVMTTNYPEKLDPALIRGGRVDYRLDFPFADAATMAAMFSNFYSDTFTPENFKGVEAQPAATVQTVLLMHRDDHKKALEALAA